MVHGPQKIERTVGDKILELYDSGLSPKDVANFMNEPYGLINRFIRFHRTPREPSRNLVSMELKRIQYFVRKGLIP